MPVPETPPHITPNTKPLPPPNPAPSPPYSPTHSCTPQYIARASPSPPTYTTLYERMSTISGPPAPHLPSHTHVKIAVRSHNRASPRPSPTPSYLTPRAEQRRARTWFYGVVSGGSEWAQERITRLVCWARVYCGGGRLGVF